MKAIHPIAAIAMAGGAIGSPAAASGKPSASPPLSAFAQGILGLHNRERARVGSPPLRWDRALEAAASAHARQLASANRLAHSPRAGRSNQGENLSMGMRGAAPPQMMHNWIVEKRDFVPGIFPDISRTGQWSEAAHYSQMIWAGTTSIGCGQATGVQWDYLVCRYSPSGNVDGRPALTTPCGSRPTTAAAGPDRPRMARQQPPPGTHVPFWMRSTACRSASR